MSNSLKKTSITFTTDLTFRTDNTLIDRSVTQYYKDQNEIKSQKKKHKKSYVEIDPDQDPEHPHF